MHFTVKRWLVVALLLLPAGLLADAESTPIIDPASLQAPAPSSDIPRTTWRERLQWPDSCEANFSDVTGWGGVYLYPIDDATYLVAVDCDIWAYQSLQRVYRVELRDGREIVIPLRFVVAEEGGTARAPELVQREEITGNLLTEPPRGRLILHRRYSGFGDCGTYAVYDMTQGAPVLIELRAQTDCLAEPKERDPTRWPEVTLSSG